MLKSKQNINLVVIIKLKVICQKNNLTEQLGIELIPYKKAVELAFDKINSEEILSTKNLLILMELASELFHFQC